MTESISEPVNNYYYIIGQEAVKEDAANEEVAKEEVPKEQVPKEEYDAYDEELTGGVAPLEWHEFTGENIDRYVAD